MKLEFWTAMNPSPEHAARFATWAEQVGWDGVAVYDSQNIFADCYVALAIASSATQSLGLSTGVTNPFTRHPATAACAIASIQQASGGRAVLGIGRGNSALAHIGRGPVYMEMFERYLSALQTYLSGEQVEFDDVNFCERMAPPVETLGLTDAPKNSNIRFFKPTDKKVPVEVTATGPRAISLAARHADRIMFGLGADPERVKWGIEEARRARREAGLNPNDMKFGIHLNVVCHPDLDIARQLVNWWALNVFARFTMTDSKLAGSTANREEEVLSDLHRSSNLLGNDSGGRLPVGFIDQFAIMGPPETCIDRIRELAKLGIEKVVVVGPGDNLITVEEGSTDGSRASQLFTKEVLPVFTG